MAALVPALVYGQALGAVIGVATAVWGELAYMRAMKDGKVDTAEHAHLQLISRGLRFGMVLLLLASLGLVIAAYKSGSAPQPAVTVSYWTFVVLVAVITWATWALSHKKVSFALGSALVFSGWWFLLFLELGFFPLLTFGATIALYVICTAIFYVLLRYLRFLNLPGTL